MECVENADAEEKRLRAEQLAMVDIVATLDVFLEAAWRARVQESIRRTVPTTPPGSPLGICRTMMVRRTPTGSTSPPRIPRERAAPRARVTSLADTSRDLPLPQWGGAWLVGFLDAVPAPERRRCQAPAPSASSASSPALQS